MSHSAKNDIGSCFGLNARSVNDVVFSFTTSRTTSFRADAFGGERGPRLCMRAAACVSTAIACAAGGTSSAFLQGAALPAGTDFLFSAPDSSGTVAITITLN